MSSEVLPKPESQRALLKTIKALVSLPAQVFFYGSALLAVAATGGANLPGGLETFGTAIGMNALASILERVTRGEEVPQDEIRKTVKEVIRTSSINELLSTNDFQRAIGRVFRRLDLLQYAAQREEIAVVSILSEQFANYAGMLEELHAELSGIREQIGTLATREQTEEIIKSVHELAEQDILSRRYFPTGLVDQKIEKDLDILRKSRFFAGFDSERPALAFAKSLTEGECSGGTEAVRSRALAWCARILSTTDKISEGEKYLSIARELGTATEIEIAHAFIHSRKSDRNAALSVVANLATPMARSAALMIVTHHDGPANAVNWLNTVGIKLSDLDPEGKNFLLAKLLELAYWDGALECLAVLTDEDLREAPVINHTIAITYLISVIPDELRSAVLFLVPFGAANFPLAADTTALQTRRLAHQHFTTAAQIARQYNCHVAAAIDDDYALWLELLDPEFSAKGRQTLAAKLRDPESALRLVHLGLQFGIKFDLDAIEREIERQTALHGGITFDATVARFALALTQPTPENAANYIAHFQNELAKFLDKKFMMGFQIEMLVQARLPAQASECLAILVQEGLSEAEERRIRRRIAEAEGTDAVESRKEQFKETNSLTDLQALVDELTVRNDWEGVNEYGQILFERTHSLQDVERLVISLSRLHKDDQIVKFLEMNKALLPHSKNLQMHYCWSLYHEGALLEARSELAKISKERNDPNYLALVVNLGIALGDWNSLLVFVAEENAEKDKRSAQELIGAARLAFQLGSPYTKELILAAAEKGKDDAGALVAAYFLATNAELEDNEEVFKWLQRAAVLSGDNGPVQRMSLRDVLARKPEWDRHQSEIWQLWSSGNIPMFLAAQSLNNSLINLMLFPALTNPLEEDPRRRSLIPAYSGNRQSVPLSTHQRVGIDATALLTLHFLNLLDKGLDAFDSIYIPHSTLAWLFEEKQRATFHQPSRIRKAHQILDMLATDVLERFMPSMRPDSDLAAQVGDELASLIAEAEKVTDDSAQRIVVRPFPVHDLVSFMDEEADLNAHDAVLSSCQSIVDKLREKGYITAEEEKRSRAYLRLQERPWPNQPEIVDGAILYLDDLAITYFHELRVLDKLRSAGYRPIVSSQKISECKELVAYEKISDEIHETIEDIRFAINSRIESGKIKVGRQHSLDKSQPQSISEHPTIDMISLAGYCDAIVADDRWLNQHTNVEDSGAQAPIFTSLDVLNGLISVDAITPEELLEYRTRLRRAGYFFIPLIESELENFLADSVIRDGKTIETAELKAIRESFLSIQMSTWLQLPKEAFWLDTSLKVFIQVLRRLWRADADLSIAQIHSDWILNQLDFRGWAHRLESENRENFVKIGRVAYILMLIAPLIDMPRQVLDTYWNWIDDRILAPIKEYSPDLFSWIVDWFSNEIAKVMNPVEGEQLDE